MVDGWMGDGRTHDSHFHNPSSISLVYLWLGELGYGKCGRGVGELHKLPTKWTKERQEKAHEVWALTNSTRERHGVLLVVPVFLSILWG
jgi:hypothetical protein